MKRFLLLLLLSGCITAPVQVRDSCWTPCGMHVLGPRCEEAQVQEARTLVSLERYVPGEDAMTSCRVLSSYTVDLAPELDVSGLGWLSGDHEISGQTDCTAHRIRVANPFWARNGFSHEIAHAVEGCKDKNHLTWTSRGVNQALQDLK